MYLSCNITQAYCKASVKKWNMFDTIYVDYMLIILECYHNGIEIMSWLWRPELLGQQGIIMDLSSCPIIYSFCSWHIQVPQYDGIMHNAMLQFYGFLSALAACLNPQGHPCSCCRNDSIWHQTGRSYKVAWMEKSMLSVARNCQKPDIQQNTVGSFFSIVVNNFSVYCTDLTQHIDTILK